MIELVEYPEELKRLRELWDSDRRTWLEKAKKEEELYHNDVEGTGTNFTAKQLEKINKVTGVPVNVNYIHPLLNQKLAILASTKPSFRIVGLDDRGKQFAGVLDKAVKSVMYTSEATGEEEETIKQMLISGMGISFIQEADTYEFGTFNIQFEDIHPSLVILDVNSKKRSMKDARGFFIEKEISINEAEMRYSGILSEINKQRVEAGDQPITMEYFTETGPTDVVGRGKIKEDWWNRKITVTEFYDKTFTSMYFVPDEKGNMLRMFEENLSEETQYLLNDQLEVEKNMFVRKTILLGNWMVGYEIKPIKQFPIKVKFFEWGGSPYKSYGMVHYIKDMQDTLDKAVQLMITNGMLTNNAGYTSPKGGIAIEDKSKWETEGNKPGTVKEYVPQQFGNDVFIPRREEIQQLSSFYPTIIQLMAESMKTSTGITAAISGDSQEANIDVFSTLKQYQDASMQRVKLAMAHINLANEQLGGVVLDYLMANIKLDEQYSFFDSGGKYNELKILKDEMAKFSQSRYMVLSIASEAMPTEKLSMANTLMKISQSTSDPYEKNIYIKKAFELSDMRGFDEMKDEVDSIKKLQSQIQQLTEQIDRDKQLMKQFQNKAINAEYKAELMKKLSTITANIEVAASKTTKDIEIQKLKEEIKGLQKENKEEK